MTDPEHWEGDWKSTKRFNRVDDEDIQEVSCLPDLNEHLQSTTSKTQVLQCNRVILAAVVLVIGVSPAFAQVSFVGDWTGRYHEDQPDRVPGEEPGDFSGLPINDAARLFGDSWDVARHSVLEHQCAPYTLPYMFFGPNQFRIWEEKQP